MFELNDISYNRWVVLKPINWLCPLHGAFSMLYRIMMRANIKQRRGVFHTLPKMTALFSWKHHQPHLKVCGAVEVSTGRHCAPSLTLKQNLSAFTLTPYQLDEFVYVLFLYGTETERHPITLVSSFLSLM